MNGKAFLDTNLLIYLYSEKELAKRSIACEIIDKYDCMISIQSIKEASNVWYKKFGWNGAKIEKHINNLVLLCDDILQISIKTVFSAISIKDKYAFSFYDCLIIASAIEADCELLFSEDMQDGQVINGTLKITNPFGIT